VTSTLYDSAGRVSNRTLGSGTVQAYTYYPWNTQGGRLQGLTAGTLENFTYTYDPVGNITQIVDSVNTQTQTFGYDALDRLTSATVTGGPEPYSELYGYHPTTGNLSSKAGSDLIYNAQVTCSAEPHHSARRFATGANTTSTTVTATRDSG
jgi:YD repeat-containing protein